MLLYGLLSIKTSLLWHVFNEFLRVINVIYADFTAIATILISAIATILISMVKHLNGEAKLSAIFFKINSRKSVYDFHTEVDYFHRRFISVLS